MKTFIFLVLFSINAHANFVAPSKINECNRTAYLSQGVCSETEGEPCVALPENDPAECGTYKLADKFGTLKFEPESCLGEVECQAILESKECSQSRRALIDAEFTEVYCVDVLGKEVAVDTVVRAQKLAEKTQIQAQLNLRGMVKKLRECGAGVMDILLIRNQPKGLSTAQVKALVKQYADIKRLLESGSLVSAKEEILAAQADGVLVTEGDKLALAAEVDKCLAQ